MGAMAHTHPGDSCVSNHAVLGFIAARTGFFPCTQEQIPSSAAPTLGKRMALCLRHCTRIQGSWVHSCSTINSLGEPWASPMSLAPDFMCSASKGTLMARHAKEPSSQHAMPRLFQQAHPEQCGRDYTSWSNAQLKRDSDKVKAY